MTAKDKILVLISDALIARDLQGLLNESRYHTVFSHTAHTLPEDASDCIAAIIDLDTFDKSNALQICDKLNIPVICLSIHTDEAKALYAPEGSIITVEKPFARRDLCDALERAIRHHHLANHSYSCQWFSSALRSIDQGIIATGPEGLVEFINPAAQRLLCISQTQALNLPLTDILPLVNPVTGEKIRESEYFPPSDVQSSQVHALLQRPDGTVRYIADTISPIRNQSGTTIGTVMAITDITDRFRQSPHSLDSSKQTASLAQVSHQYTQDAVILIDPSHGLILDANPTVEHLFGWRVSELIGRHFDILRGDETDTLDKIRAEGPAFVEQIMKHRDGHHVYIDLMAAVVPFGKDKAIIANLRHADDRARKSQKNRNTLEAHRLHVREMNHRIKNHLHTISSLLRTRARNLHDSKTRRSLLNCAGQVRAIGLLHSELSRRSDDMTLDLGHYIRRLVPYVIEAAGSEEAAPHMDINIARLPLRPHQATPAALLIFEILNNALRHAWPEGTGKGEVRITGQMDESGRACIEIADDGVGFNRDSSPGGMGLELIDALAAQLDADISKSGPPKTKYRICWNTHDESKVNS